MFEKVAKKLKVLSICLIFMLSGCYSGGIPIFNNYSFFAPKNEVVVSKGETLYSISRRYNVEMKDLISANSLKSPYILKVGQRLRLPKSNYHVVQKGDTLYSISKKYGTDVTTLSRLNHVQSANSLYIGQRLLIPAGNGKYQPSTSYKTAQKSTIQNQKWAANNIGASKQTSANSYAQSSAGKTKLTKYRKNKFAWPVKGTIVSKFGAVGKGVNNDGINIRAAKGTAVKAADEGVVAYSGNGLKGYGNLVLIKHSDGWITAYAHNDKLFVKKGQKVRKGEKIATVGNTGGVSSSQLHFETRVGKTAHNPLNYL